MSKAYPLTPFVYLPDGLTPGVSEVFHVSCVVCGDAWEVGGPTLLAASAARDLRSALRHPSVASRPGA